MIRHLPSLLAVVLAAAGAFAAEPPPVLPGTARLEFTGDLARRTVDEAHALLERKLAEAVAERGSRFRRDHASPRSYAAALEPHRQRLRRVLGMVDPRVAVVMERFGDDRNPALVAETPHFRAWQVRWSVLEGITGEGLLLEPREKPRAHAVAIPDADQTPEQITGLAPGVQPESQFARRLAENGFRVVVPVLLDRSCTFSGNPLVAMTNQPHREWIYRQAYQMGRHPIGFEVQKVLAAIEWLDATAEDDARLAVAGYGEGGLLAFYAAALEPRIDGCLVSGYFNAREALWEEPIYRNVWGLLREFGDAEVASLIVPRTLIVEHSPFPEVSGPPPAEPPRRQVAAPGRLSTPGFSKVEAEFARIDQLDPQEFGRRELIAGVEGRPIGPGSPQALGALARAMSVQSAMGLDAALPEDRRRRFDPVARQGRQVKELERFVQQLMRVSDRVRDRFFRDKVSRDSAAAFVEGAKSCRGYLREEVIGRLDDPLVPPAPRSRLVYDEPEWTGYEVVLDVFPELHAWGILCVPKDLARGERRPVVVCQHGLEGLPEDTITREGRAFAHYRAFAAVLAQRGFVTFAPFNLYRGKDHFRLLQRKANPLGLSLFSIITRQHEQILSWLDSLPMVDADRIAFYGLSYGGKTAMRVPAQLEGYCLSICSADFNDWIRKNVTVEFPYSYMFTGEWEMPEFNLGHTFNYAEMAYLIFPRPLMVERGHHDGVAPDWWVAYEYAKVRLLYDVLGRGDATEIEFFDGPHAIRGEGAFRFLHRHLNWPEPETGPDGLEGRGHR